MQCHVPSWLLLMICSSSFLILLSIHHFFPFSPKYHNSSLLPSFLPSIHPSIHSLCAPFTVAVPCDGTVCVVHNPSSLRSAALVGSRRFGPTADAAGQPIFAVDYLWCLTVRMAWMSPFRTLPPEPCGQWRSGKHLFGEGERNVIGMKEGIGKEGRKKGPWSERAGQVLPRYMYSPANAIAWNSAYQPLMNASINKCTIA